MAGEEYNTKDGRWNPAVVGIVCAVLGSSGGVALVFNTPIGEGITRPDPFTGTQGAALISSVVRVESQIDDHLHNHPSDVNQFDRRIATLEAQYAIILQNQGRILDRLDDR